MIRNFVAGALWGGVVAVVGLGVLSQVTLMPVVAGLAQAGATLDAAEPDAAEAALPAEPKAAPPAPVEPAGGVDPTAKVPVLQPGVLGKDAAGKDAAASKEAAAGKDAAAGGVSPSELLAATPPSAKADTAQPEAQAPVAQPDAPADAPAALVLPGAAGVAPAVAMDSDPAPEATAPGGLPAATSAELAPANAELPPPPVVVPDESLLDAAPVPVDVAPADIVPEPVPAAAPPRPGVLADPAPGTLAPVEGVQDKVAGVTTGRLPRIGAEDPAEVEVALAEPLIADDAPPILRFARPFQNDSGKPLFAVILRDTGGADVDRAKLAALPFPVTFVVDPLAETAAEAATIYRAAGQEVVMQASGIPKGAQASDLEQTFQSHAGTLPDAVAVMDPGVGGFQDDRPLATQVVPLIKSQGRGLITFDRGLNAADQVARREDVPSATIFRQLDAEGEDTPLIRRYLDRAAFKAAQEGRVMVLGDTRPETIAALMEWTLEGRASSVTLAPVTAVMAVR